MNIAQLKSFTAQISFRERGKTETWPLNSHKDVIQCFNRYSVQNDYCRKKSVDMSPQICPWINHFKIEVLWQKHFLKLKFSQKSVMLVNCLWLYEFIL